MFERKTTRRLAQSALYVLVFSFLQVHFVDAQPQFPQPNILKQETHEGDLVLNGTQVMTIENTRFTVRGQIFLQDSAQLIIRQSMIELIHQPEAFISLSGAAKLRADTTLIGGSAATTGIDISKAEMFKGIGLIVDKKAQVVMNHCFALFLDFMGESKGVLRNCYIHQEAIGIVHVEGQSDVLIEDSIVGALTPWIPPNVPVNIDSLYPGYFEHWSAREAFADSLPYRLVLKRTHLTENDKGYKGGLEMGWNIGIDSKSKVNISNSKLNKLAIEFPENEPVVLSDLVMRKPINFDYGSIHVTNTEIQTQWGLFLFGGTAEILNSEGVWLFMSGGSGNVIVFNSEVGEIDPRQYSGTLIFENSIWLGGYEIFDNSHIRIVGSVRMLPTVPIFDATSTMTRNYEVTMLKDADGSPWPGLQLSLTKDGSSVWHGTTDENGKVSFDITFNLNNYQDEWKMSSSDTTINMHIAFSIFRSNPVKISLELEEDGAHYWPVIHVAQENAGFPFGTLESPYTSIQEAIDNSGGGIIRVDPGDYQGFIPPGADRGGLTLKDGVVLLGSGADKTTLDAGVGAEDVDDAQISGFAISNGIHVLSSSITITNNIIARDSTSAISGHLSTLKILNNVLTNNGASGIFLGDSCHATIKNNILVNNGLFGIEAVPTGSALIDYNDVWGNTENYTEFSPAGPHDISEDPMFVDAGVNDYRLLSGSPCIDAGDPDAKYNDPDGSRNDMGAFGGPQGIITSVEFGDSQIPPDIFLYQNFPNPFNAQTRISFDLPKQELVNLSVYNILGQGVRTLINVRRKAGHYTVVWDGKNDAGKESGSGLYFYRLTAGKFVKTGKALLLK